MYSSKFELINQLKENKLWLSKGLGQHFLVDPTYLGEIIGAAELEKGETVVEIGPGMGILTAALSDTLPEGRVICLETDYKFVERVREGIGKRKNVSVIHTDALKFDWESLEIGKVGYKVVANLPYQITSPLLNLLLMKIKKRPERITLMVQKEVAERLTTLPGSRTRGLTTVMVELTSQAKVVTEVPPEAFFPPPAVNSAIIDLVLTPINGDEETIMKIAKAGFSNKRRTLSNSLSGSLRLPKRAVEAILNEAGIDPMLRAEDLSIENWRKLTNVIHEKLNEITEADV